MQPPIMPIVVFILCYALFVALPKWRSLVACGGALALVLTGTLPWHNALTELIQDKMGWELPEVATVLKAPTKKRKRA